MRLDPEIIDELQSNTSNIRNICVLAHVDHGKTTLADSLIAANGIISARLAGQLRYMDSLAEEQARGITMKASAISLHYTIQESNYLINLIDSPGHVDFCGEVSTATRLCDGCIVLVDVVEGVCPQTHAVLRQACKEGLQPLLVMNKIDRLILELKMTALEAYTRLTLVLAEVNSIAGSIFVSSLMAAHETETGDSKTAPLNFEDIDSREQKLYFAPETGNVLFASAIDGWAFGLEHFAEILAKKTGLDKAHLVAHLWGDNYFDSKHRVIKTGAAEKNRQPLFAQMCLQSICNVYDCTINQPDIEKMTKIVNSIGVKISPRDLKSKETRVKLQSIMGQWLPLANAVLHAVCTYLPAPNTLDETRCDRLIDPKTTLYKG